MTNTSEIIRRNSIKPPSEPTSPRSHPKRSDVNLVTTAAAVVSQREPIYNNVIIMVAVIIYKQNTFDNMLAYASSLHIYLCAVADIGKWPMHNLKCIPKIIHPRTRKYIHSKYFINKTSNNIYVTMWR